MNTQIKLILRALLPLLFIGANRIGQHIARPHFIPDDAAVRVEVLFPAFLLFFFPIILLIHGCICYTSNPQLSSSASFLRLNVLSSLN